MKEYQTMYSQMVFLPVHFQDALDNSLSKFMS